MANSLIRIWKNKGKILEGIKNSIFKQEHIEEIAKLRNYICEVCPHLDTKGDKCAIPGTQNCCSLCGCSLKLKLRSLSSACDDGRWNAELTPQEEDQLNEQLNTNSNDTNFYS